MAADKESTYPDDAPTYRRIRDRVRVFNKRSLNPVTLRFAGRRFSPYGVVRHIGRRSGRTYDTPVVVATSGDWFVVPLPYGIDVDWYQNVRAADECTILYQGSAYRGVSPRLVDPAAVPEAFPEWVHRLVRRGGAGQYLRVKRGEAVPEVYREVTEEHPVEPLVAGVAVLFLLGAVVRQLAKVFN